MLYQTAPITPSRFNCIIPQSTLPNPPISMSNDPRNFSAFLQDPVNFPLDDDHHQLGFAEPPPASFTDYLQGPMDYRHLSNALGLSPSSSSDVFSSVETTTQKRQPPSALPVSETTANSSSVSSSSTEAAAGGGEVEEDSERSRRKKEIKGREDEDQAGGEESSNKKGGKGKKKGEKKEKEARISFMTKSEVDHLEDGYRWRKYGQKAVKNSPYPRSYYRCTTQKCNVKKRVERSFQDPSIVITTYEGQHNHHVPATLRGHAAGVFAHSLFTAPPGLHHSHQADLFLQMAAHGGRRAGSSPLAYNLNNAAPQPPAAVLPSSLGADHGYHQQNLSHLRQQMPDYGLLQDMVPSFLLKQEP